MNIKPRLAVALVVSSLACLLTSSLNCLPSRASSPDHGFFLKAIIFDPEHTGSPSAFFENIDGLLALHMSMTKNVVYPPGAAAGAKIKGPHLEPLSHFAPHLTLSKIAFDLTTDSQNQGGAPRFNIYDDKGDQWLMTCLEMQQFGETESVSSNWVRIKCNPANIPEVSTGPNPGLRFTNDTVVSKIEIIFDFVTVPGAFANMAHVTLNGGAPCTPYLKQ